MPLVKHVVLLGTFVLLGQLGQGCGASLDLPSPEEVAAQAEAHRQNEPLPDPLEDEPPVDEGQQQGPDNTHDGGETEKPPDTLPVTVPKLVASRPLANETDVPVNSVLYLEFSEQIEKDSLAVRLSPNHELGTAVWAEGDLAVTIPLAAPLKRMTRYEILVGASAVTGRSLESASISFTTEPEKPEPAKPTIVSSQPATGTEGIAPQTALRVRFNLKMDTANTKLTVSPAVTMGEVTWQEAGTVLNVASAALKPDTAYTVTVTGKSAEGGVLDGPVKITFRTTPLARPSNTPAIASVSPANNTKGIARNRSIQIKFTNSMDRSSVEKAFLCPCVQGVFTWNADSTSVTFKPSAPLPANAQIVWGITDEAKDAFGVKLARFGAKFDTGATQ